VSDSTVPDVDYKSTTRERFLGVEAATVSDVLDDMGIRDQGLSPSIQAVTGSVVAGWAYTITGQSVPYDGGGDPKKMEACHGIGPDEVSVWSGNGTGVCYFGELIALGMAERGSTGTVIDGGLRDVSALREHGFTAFAAYKSAVQSIGRWRVTGFQVPVYLHGATSTWVKVNPGDFVLGDEDGAIVVPSDVVDQVLEAAEAMTETETRVRTSLREGMSLEQALEKYGHI
jgi:4-hydroxy-4-methyl-2-oxoglutarate aldolase